MKDLINEYMTTCEVLENHVSKLKAQLLVARGDDAVSLQKRIELLREEIFDVRQIIDYLVLTYGSPSTHLN